MSFSKYLQIISPKKHHNGFAIALAWPETLCKQAGAWYDNLMHFVGINSRGYYRVGHAAIVLVDGNTGNCHYFDFGRYHAPHGHGRVRSTVTDHDLKIRTKAHFSHEMFGIENISDILSELQNNVSTHGTGRLLGSVIPINFNKAHRYAMHLNGMDYIPYGPFLQNGTNCSRFVNSVLYRGTNLLITKLLLKIPWMLTPTPMWNLRSTNSKILSASKSIISIPAENIDHKIVLSHD